MASHTTIESALYQYVSVGFIYLFIYYINELLFLNTKIFNTFHKGWIIMSNITEVKIYTQDF